jgi:hypothetical protein
MIANHTPNAATSAQVRTNATCPVFIPVPSQRTTALQLVVGFVKAQPAEQVDQWCGGGLDGGKLVGVRWPGRRVDQHGDTELFRVTDRGAV